VRDSPLLLRCFPRADRPFQREVERLFAGWVEAQQGRNLDPEAFQATLRAHYPSAFVRPQDPLASLSGEAFVWYVHRRDEPSPTGPQPATEALPGREPAAGPGSTPVYSAARVAEMIGVPISVLVRWEDDGLVRASRTSGGLALYSRNDVETLLTAKRALADGRSLDEVRALLARPVGERAMTRPAVTGRRLLVLLAERDPYAAEFSEYFLRTEGYEVEVALTALEAETRAMELLPDLSVVELLISGGTGAELCARLKVRPNARVLAISTLDFEDGALRAGADAFLAKPFDPLTFVSTVKDLLGESAMLRADAMGSAPAAHEEQST